VSLGVGFLGHSSAPAQDPEASPLRLGGLTPGGGRIFVTESWGTLDFELTNLTDTDRQARVLIFYDGQPDVRYARDVWVPAHSTLLTWMLAGPAPPQPHELYREFHYRLSELSGGKERPLVIVGQEKDPHRSVLYHKREPFTAIVMDEDPPEQRVFGRLPQPPSRADEMVPFARTIRHAFKQSESVQIVPPANLPPTWQGLDGVDQCLIASGGVGDNPAGLKALRGWLERGGTAWVMLDRVAPEAVAPLLGAALDFQVVDRVSLTHFRIDNPAAGRPPAQQHERPVDFARVLLPPGERVRHTIDGWPAWFTRRVGWGKVIFTTLGPRGWHRPRRPPPWGNDRASPYPKFPSLPVATEALEELVNEVQLPPEELPTRLGAFDPVLAEEIGYKIVDRGTVTLVFAAFLAAALALGVVLRKARRPELLGWLGPAAALGAAGVAFALGESSRQAAPPTVAFGQVVHAVPGTDEVTVQGRLAVYRPASGLAEVGARRGGFFDLDMTGLEGRARRLVLTDMDAWHLENLALPAGVRLGSFRYVAATAEPIEARVRLGPEGVEGRLTPGPFRVLGDAILDSPGDRQLAVRLQADGTFRAAGSDTLAKGQYLASPVLSDRQQHRQALYRRFLKRNEVTSMQPRRLLLLAWAEPLDMHFTLAARARQTGDALLVVPLRLERPAPGARLTIPGPLLPYRRLIRDRLAPITRESELSADMDLRFQLPPEVLPFKVERARLAAKVIAPARRVTVSGWTGTRFVEVDHVQGPLDPIRIDIADERYLRLDEQGGLRVQLSMGELTRKRGGFKGDAKWRMEYLELEVTGRRER
jgi:hypothetical protein